MLKSGLVTCSPRGPARPRGRAAERRQHPREPRLLLERRARLHVGALRVAGQGAVSHPL